MPGALVLVSTCSMMLQWPYCTKGRCGCYCVQRRMVYDGQQRCFSVSAYDPETESYLIPVVHAGETLPAENRLAGQCSSDLAAI
jgi:hypothetical protein